MAKTVAEQVEDLERFVEVFRTEAHLLRSENDVVRKNTLAVIEANLPEKS